MIFFFTRIQVFLFFFEGVNVREDWLVLVNLFYKESKPKKKKKKKKKKYIYIYIYIYIFFFFFRGGGGGGGEATVSEFFYK